MRWPLRRHSTTQTEPASTSSHGSAATTSGETTSGETTDRTRPSTELPTSDPDRSRPRADWAQMATLATASQSRPPTTFDGSEFGRSVAGAHSPIRRKPRVVHGLTPAGVLLDVARVEGVLQPAAEVIHGDARSLPAAPQLLHRKRVVAADRAVGLASDLTRSDRDFDFPTVELGHAPERVQPITWTPERGFVEQDEPDEQFTTRVFRPRASSGGGDRGSDRGPQGAGDTALDDDGGDGIGDDMEDRVADHVEVLPTMRFVPVAGPRRVAPPRDLVDAVRHATGVDVGDTEIDRSPMVSDRAAGLGAIAFTERGSVHLPEELGPLDEPRVRSIAAHELVHVAQQRTRAGEVPAENSVEGRQLERQARAVQRSVEGGGVLPTFLRHHPGTHVSAGSVGVQRLARENPEWLGTDLSDEDYSSVEPRSSADIFEWQERDGEPYPSEWQTRRDWAEAFEQEHSSMLQLRRDERYRHLVQEVTGGAVPLSHAAAISVRQRLESEMPYQFGPPFDIDPYPDQLPDGQGGALTGGAGTTTVVPVATEGERTAATHELVHITSRARTANASAGDGSFSLTNLDDIFERRFERERVIRMEVLEAKRQAAIGERAVASHVVALSEEEVAQIRAAVDLEIPLNVADMIYLETSSIMRMSVAGEVDAEASAATGSAGGSSGANAPAHGAAGGSSTTSTSPAGDAAASPGPTAGAQATAATDAMQRIMDRVNEQAPAAGAGAGAYSLTELDDRFEARFDLEKRLRFEVMQAKIGVAVENRAAVGTIVSITQAELAQIRQAVQAELPLDVRDMIYLETDEYLSYEITQADVDAVFPAGTVAATASSIAFPDATSAATEQGDAAGASALDPTADDQPAGGGSRGGGVGGAVATAVGAAVGAAAASGTASLVRALSGDEPYAGQEMSAHVVQQMSELDLEILARRLWGRLRRELRSELLIDRERAGVLADVR